MSFILVIVQRPNHRDPAWAVFHTHAKVDDLKGKVGVFYIDETAWIFDTRTALPEFGLMIHQACAQGMQLHSFQLDTAALQSHLASYPRSKKLEEFLAS